MHIHPCDMPRKSQYFYIFVHNSGVISVTLKKKNSTCVLLLKETILKNCWIRCHFMYWVQTSLLFTLLSWALLSWLTFSRSLPCSSPSSLLFLSRSCWSDDCCTCAACRRDDSSASFSLTDRITRSFSACRAVNELFNCSDVWQIETAMMEARRGRWQLVSEGNPIQRRVRPLSLHTQNWLTLNTKCRWISLTSSRSLLHYNSTGAHSPSRCSAESSSRASLLPTSPPAPFSASPSQTSALPATMTIKQHHSHTSTLNEHVFKAN